MNILKKIVRETKRVYLLLLFLIIAMGLSMDVCAYQSKKSPQDKAHKYSAPSKYWALIIGVSQYKNKASGLNTLNYADNDALEVKRALLEMGWKKNQVKFIINEAASKTMINDVVNGWLRNVQKNDLLFVFWAGHGYPDFLDSQKVYFACYDTDLKMPWTGYRMDKLVDRIKEHGIKNVVLIADTCHAGKIITRSGEKALSVNPYIENILKNKNIPKGWIFMAATETDRPTVEDKSWKNGAFTYCLLNGLRGKADGASDHGVKDGNVSLGELKVFVEVQMPLVTKRVSGIIINPIITTNTSDKKIWDINLNNMEK